ncbi:hypothetical protein NDU88_003800 [Pleurodeles waltl]|uniref:Uncharacterized protein n=1 Tax=Pleurodeles waltl TaxID=8319 RepID=A0AAV7L6V6_PLEWA|nr:hypothetical protein NDU88_003800 [Pleurodeles waltl]
MHQGVHHGQSTNKMSTIAHDTDEASPPLQGGVENQETSEVSVHSHLDIVLPAIADTKQALQQDISAVSVGLGLLREKHHELVKMVKIVQNTVKEIKLDEANLTHNLCDLTERVKVLEQRL